MDSGYVLYDDGSSKMANPVWRCNKNGENQSTYYTDQGPFKLIGQITISRGCRTINKAIHLRQCVYRDRYFCLPFVLKVLPLLLFHFNNGFHSKTGIEHIFTINFSGSFCSQQFIEHVIFNRPYALGFLFLQCVILVVQHVYPKAPSRGSPLFTSVT